MQIYKNYFKKERKWLKKLGEKSQLRRNFRL